MKRTVLYDTTPTLWDLGDGRGKGSSDTPSEPAGPLPIMALFVPFTTPAFLCTCMLFFLMHLTRQTIGEGLDCVVLLGGRHAVQGSAWRKSIEASSWGDIET